MIFGALARWVSRPDIQQGLSLIEALEESERDMGCSDDDPLTISSRPRSWLQSALGDEESHLERTPIAPVDAPPARIYAHRWRRWMQQVLQDSRTNFAVALNILRVNLEVVWSSIRDNILRITQWLLDIGILVALIILRIAGWLLGIGVLVALTIVRIALWLLPIGILVALIEVIIMLRDQKRKCPDADL